ncbi:glyoxalase superfamily protein [Jeongeupia naejangsanensis]|uniref:Glyoxalase-related protein domain-containing protein n=1 Tax=Jeongeupia naejangsanensis TaxID=613195 RepID=A0ABS2BNW5_9NEIS|nr:glyoxalase superfamily protein [Jeongeupia naejangsanensis]MBM3117324.1 hypothetical protein [Jeongeupia naejangsanensis]
MRTYRDAKLMAKSLRHALAERNIELGHGECLDVIARLFEHDNWNVLSARIEVDQPPALPNKLLLPEGWLKAGSRPELYLMGVDQAARHQGQHPAVVRCILSGEAGRIYDKDPGFGTLMQMAKAEAYRGKHLRLRAQLRCEDATSAQMWLRIDSKFTRAIRFDNMDNRPLRGTRDWTPAEIVLSVPEEAEHISFGFFVTGTGTAWASGFTLETVGSEQVETGARAMQVLEAPSNLDFSTIAQPAT